MSILSFLLVSVATVTVMLFSLYVASFFIVSMRRSFIASIFNRNRRETVAEELPVKGALSNPQYVEVEPFTSLEKKVDELGDLIRTLARPDSEQLESAGNIPVSELEKRKTKDLAGVD